MDKKPRKTRKAGIRKLASRGISNKQFEKPSKEFELWNRVQTARAAGDLKEAVRQLDLLIAYVEKVGKPSFEYQVDKLLMEDPGNFAQLIPIYENQLNYYIRRKERMGQLEALISLTAVCINSGQLQQAKDYIDLAEGLIPSVQDEMKNLDKKSSITGISRMEGKLEQIQQAKKYINETLKSDP